MALVDLLSPDFMAPKLQASIKLQIKCFMAVLLGAGGMSLVHLFWLKRVLRNHFTPLCVFGKHRKFGPTEINFRVHRKISLFWRKTILGSILPSNQLHPRKIEERERNSKEIALEAPSHCTQHRPQPQIASLVAPARSHPSTGEIAPQHQRKTHP